MIPNTAMRLLCIVLSCLAACDIATAQVAKGRPHFYSGVQVICIGIDEYYSPGIPRLNQAVADTKILADVLEKQFAFSPAKFLLNKDATRTAIFQTLDEVERQSPPPEVVVLFFACHGTSFEVTDKDNPVPVRVGYFVPYDAQVELKDTSRPALWEQEAVSMRAVVDRIEKLKCRHVLLIADTCCSGFLTKRGGLESREMVSLLSDPSRTILAATTQNESARDGFFTKELVAVLKQSAKDSDPLSVTDVFQKLRYSVPQKAGIKMTPQMSHVGAGDGEFVFIPKSVSDGEVAKLKEAVAEVGKGGKYDNAKLVAFRGLLERKQKLLGRQSRLTDLVLALDAGDYRFAADAEDQAKRWQGILRGFQENAGLGDVWAMAGLHVCYAQGLGADVSADDAYYWAKQADQFRAPAGVGRFLLGRCYEQGLGVAKNPITANRLYAESSKLGFPLADWAIAAERLRTKPAGEEREAIRPLLENAAKTGYCQATMLLAKFHFGPKNGNPNFEEGIRLLKEAADKNHAPAHQALYETYLKDPLGKSSKDLVKAKTHLLRAAELGYSKSQTILAREYYRKSPYPSSLDFPQDFQQAFHWATLSASQSNAAAHVFLSFLYERGDGVKRDHAKAKQHLETAALTLNDKKAKNTLAIYHLEGKLVPFDPQRALQLFVESANAGDPEGCYLAGKMYEEWFRPGAKEMKRYSYAGFHYQTYQALRFYLKAYQTTKHPQSKEYLDHFANWLKKEPLTVQGIQALATDSLFPRAVMNQFDRSFPDAAREFRELYNLPVNKQSN